MEPETPTESPPRPPVLDYAAPRPSRIPARMVCVTALILVLAGLVVAGVALRSMVLVNEQANRVKCANNLKAIWWGMMNYNNDPYRTYPISTRNPSYGPADIADALRLAALWGSFSSPAVYNCPSTDAVPDLAPLTAKHFAIADHRTISYALTNPNNPAPGFRWSLSQSAAWAIAADGNYPYSTSNPNSANHRGAGQNVLFNDGSARWFTTVMAGTLSTGAADDITTRTVVDPMDTQLLPLRWP
jgi:hypothetical protein